LTRVSSCTSFTAIRKHNLKRKSDEIIPNAIYEADCIRKRIYKDKELQKLKSLNNGMP
jgi:hypothetical protein